jgi:7-carboxy-7-deazaguanine synthase
VRYPVYEHFYSFQGEGLHQGRAAYFIRLYGCPQHCPWCDSAGTWHPHFAPERVVRLDAAALVKLVATSHQAAFVVLTGGEPVMYDLQPLTEALHRAGRRVHLETSGNQPIRGEIDWVTLSPKPFAQKPVRSVVQAANEVKLIVSSPQDIADGLACLEGLPEAATIWLQPEWSKARDRDAGVLGCISEAVKHDPRFRAGFQMHKMYRVDELDEHSVKALIPLGGNPELGI